MTFCTETSQLERQKTSKQNNIRLRRILYRVKLHWTNYILHPLGQFEKTLAVKIFSAFSLQTSDHLSTTTITTVISYENRTFAVAFKDSFHFYEEVISIHHTECIKKSVFPEGLEAANVSAAFKSNASYLKSNYRPISVLPSTPNILERKICSQMHGK